VKERTEGYVDENSLFCQLIFCFPCESSLSCYDNSESGGDRNMRRMLAGAVGVALLSSCGMIQHAGTARQPTFEAIRTDLRMCEERDSSANCEERTRSYLKTPRNVEEEGELRYFLIRFLAKQRKYDRVLMLLDTLPAQASYLREARRIGAEAAFALGEYGRALDLAFLVYLSLSPSEKLSMSRIVFLSYLYKGDITKAALWYSKLGEEKRALVKNEMMVFWETRPEAKRVFDEELSRLEQAESVSGEIVDKAEKEEPDFPGEVLSEMAPPGEPAFDISFRPNWDRVCLFLSEEERWRKVNGVVEVFFEWFFKEYAKSSVEIIVLRYLTHEDLPALFAEARSHGCFAGIGPLFSDIAVEHFASLSRTTPLVLFSYTAWSGLDHGLLFNFKYVKEQEADDVIRWLLARGKKRIAFAYPDDRRGRRLRDLYWYKVEEVGGIVSDALAFGPGDKALLDDVEDILSLPDGYHASLYRFKQENAEKYANPTLMKRALDRLVKMTPMQPDFDALIILGSPEQVAMLLPTFPYKNVEFEYVSPSEKNRVRENQRKLKEEFSISWPIAMVLAVAPSEVKGDGSFEKRIDRLIDGLIVAAPAQDQGEANTAWKTFVEAFAAKFKRQPYAIEQPLAEIGSFITVAREKSGKGTIGDFVSWIETSSFTTLSSNRPVKFGEKGFLRGLGDIFVGVKNRGFVPAREIFKETDEKEEGKEENSALQGGSVP